MYANIDEQKHMKYLLITFIADVKLVVYSPISIFAYFDRCCIESSGSNKTNTFE